MSYYNIVRLLRLRWSGEDCKAEACEYCEDCEAKLTLSIVHTHLDFPLVIRI